MNVDNFTHQLWGDLEVEVDPFLQYVVSEQRSVIDPNESADQKAASDENAPRVEICVLAAWDENLGEWLLESPSNPLTRSKCFESVVY